MNKRRRFKAKRRRHDAKFPPLNTWFTFRTFADALGSPNVMLHLDAEHPVALAFEQLWFKPQRS